MGFLQKLKDFFLDKEIDKEEVNEFKVKIEDMEGLLKERSQKIEGEIGEKNKDFHIELSILISKINEEKEILSKVDLSGKKGNERLISICEIGRKNYLDSINKFLNLIEDEDKDAMNVYEELNKFIKYSAKAYAKATLLIGKEMENISNSISNIKKLLDRMKSENSELYIQKIRNDELSNKYNEKIQSEIKIKDIANELEKMRGNNEKEKTKLGKIEDKIIEITKSSDYVDMIEMGIINEKDLGKLESAESNLNLLLDRRVLEKYIHSEEENPFRKIAEEYLENPVKKIITDEEFQIVSVLKDVRNKVSKGEIILKDPGKVIKKLDIPKDIFLDHKIGLIKLGEKIEKNEREIKEFEKRLPNLKNIEDDKIKINEIVENNNKNIEIMDLKRKELGNEILMLNEELVSGINKK